SVVLKQDSEYYEYFYNRTIPYMHFIPVKKDLSDIVEKINWIKEHDDDALKIAKAGRVLMRDVAMPRDVFCYHVSLFREWSKRLQNEIKVLEDMEEVLQSEYSCECSHDAGKNRIIVNSRDEF
ncbi:hypothetical protein PV326_002032, partial [Microctonus aethiopoides]